jgi:predicted nucleotidyltransferase
MSHYNTHNEMIVLTAKALGDELLRQVAFVGGCAVGLLLTDEMTKESVRYTDDVDLIVGVLGFSGWHEFSRQLKTRGFTVSIEDDVACRFRLGQLQVDFMPDDGILGFTNLWYKPALKTAQHFPIAENLNIRLVTPIYFLATKFEAFKTRGNSDLLISRDSEDILNIVDGRVELLSELRIAESDVKAYLINEFRQLLLSRDIAYAVQSTAAGDRGRERIIFERIEKMATLDSV